jgi:hypothetical protein
MIRITDEKIFTMTRARYLELWEEYIAALDDASVGIFEDWLHQVKKLPYTTHQQENP